MWPQVETGVIDDLLRGHCSLWISPQAIHCHGRVSPRLKGPVGLLRGAGAFVCGIRRGLFFETTEAGSRTGNTSRVVSAHMRVGLKNPTRILCAHGTLLSQFARKRPLVLARTHVLAHAVR